MSTSNLPGQVLNSQEIDVNALIDEIQAHDPNADPAKAPASGAGTAGAAPVKINVGGQVREFADAQKATDALQAYANEVAKRQAEMEAAAREAGAVGGGVLTTGQDDPTQPDLSPRVDQEKFAALVKAGRLDQAIALVDKVRYGGVDPKDILRALAQKVQQQDQTLSALTFVNSHQELAQADNAAKLGSVMQQMGIPKTNAGFELAYAYAKQHGMLEESAQPGGLREPDQRGGLREPPPPPPSPGRRQAASNDDAPSWLDRAEDMSPEQLRALMARLEQQRTA
ncbi:MAG: hypothetical protein ABFD89_24470 [Bryobacteraceae bacterium]